MATEIGAVDLHCAVEGDILSLSRECLPKLMGQNERDLVGQACTEREL